MTYNSKNKTQKMTTSATVDDTVLGGILAVIGNSNAKVWTGTMTKLSTTLAKTLGRKSSSMLPGSPGALRVVINRVVNRLRNRKISVRFLRTTDHARTRLVRFTF